MQEGGSPAEPNSTILAASSTLEGHGSTLRSWRLSVTMGSFFYYFFFPFSVNIFGLHFPGQHSWEFPFSQATKVSWDRSRRGKVVGLCAARRAEQGSSREGLDVVALRALGTRRGLDTKAGLDGLGGIFQPRQFRDSGTSELVLKQTPNKTPVNLSHSAQCPLCDRSGTFRGHRSSGCWWPQRYRTSAGLNSHVMGVQGADSIRD